MKIKITTSVSLALSLLAVFILPIIGSSVFAQITTVNPERKAFKQERQQNVIGLRKTKAGQEIDRRIRALNQLIVRINNMKRLTVDQKSALISQVQSIITNLQNLKTKIDNDTDLATLSADKKSIVDAYRVFVLFMPKITIMSHADRILQVAQAMQSKNPGSEAAAKIADAITQANNALNTVSGLDPSLNADSSKTIFQNARTMLQTARKDLNSAWALMKRSAVSPTISGQL